MKQTILKGLVMGALVTGSALAMSQGALADDDGKRYSVTIANATRG